MAAVGARPSRKSLHPRNSAPRQTRSARGETRTALRPLGGGAIRRGHHATARVTVTASHCESADSARGKHAADTPAGGGRLCGESGDFNDFNDFNVLTEGQGQTVGRGSRHRPRAFPCERSCALAARGVAYASSTGGNPLGWVCAESTRCGTGDSERFEEGDSALAVNSQCGRGWTPPSQKPPPLGNFSSASPRPALL